MIREFDTDEMEEPCLCDCGKWVELNDSIPCSHCNDLLCKSCLGPGGRCEKCPPEEIEVPNE